MRKTNKAQERAFELLRGPKLPDSAWRRVFADGKRHRVKEIKARSAIRQQADKYLSQIQKPFATDAHDNVNVQRAVRGLRGITDRLAKQKLVVPHAGPVQPGVLAGAYKLRFTPPYVDNGGSEYGNGNPTPLSTSSLPNLGRYGASVATDFKSPSGGFAEYEFGVSFTPLFAPATVRIGFDAQIAFSWWVNSIGPVAKSAADVTLLLAQYNPQYGAPTILPGGVRFFQWDEWVNNELNFDFGSMQIPAQLETRVTTDYYLIASVYMFVTASAAGWPGSLAGANLSVTVPSITVEVAMNLLEEGNIAL